MKYKLTTIIIGVLLVGSIVWGVYESSRIQSQDALISDMQYYLSKYSNQLRDSQATNDDLEDKQDLLQKQIDGVKLALEELTTQYNERGSELSRLQNELDELNSEYEQAKVSYMSQVVYYKSQLLNNAYFYYDPTNKTEQRYGLTDLKNYLSQLEWVEEAYEPGLFDCSQMAAYFEWRLENEGFHTFIVAGDYPRDASYGHAWLLVEIANEKYVPVEATTLSVIDTFDPDYQNYFKYDVEFETIQQAVRDYPREFIWWE